MTSPPLNQTIHRRRKIGPAQRLGLKISILYACVGRPYLHWTIRPGASSEVEPWRSN